MNTCTKFLRAILRLRMLRKVSYKLKILAQKISQESVCDKKLGDNIINEPALKRLYHENNSSILVLIHNAKYQK